MGNGTGLGRVRGLGSAKHGGNHWVLHRMTAISTLLLMLWLIFSLLRLPGYDFATIRLWLEQHYPDRAARVPLSKSSAE